MTEAMAELDQLAALDAENKEYLKELERDMIFEEWEQWENLIACRPVFFKSRVYSISQGLMYMACPYSTEVP